jgi:hypothetical protein
MKKKMILVLAVVLLAGVMAPMAFGACSPPKGMAQRLGDGVNYYYVHGLRNDGSEVGLWWEPGNAAGANNGTKPLAEWVGIFPTYANEWFLYDGELGGLTVGCPTGNMAVIITQDNGASASYAVLQATEATGQAFNFIHGDVFMQPLPKPGVTASSRVGTDVVVDLVIPNIEAGFASRDTVGAVNAVDGFVLFTAQGATDPGRAVAAWTPLATNAYEGTDASVLGQVVDCSSEVRTWLAVGLQGAGGGPAGGHVGEAVFVECDPLLADPGDKFDLIRERGQGQKKGKPFRDN